MAMPGAAASQDISNTLGRPSDPVAWADQSESRSTAAAIVSGLAKPSSTFNRWPSPCTATSSQPGTTGSVAPNAVSRSRSGPRKCTPPSTMTAAASASSTLNSCDRVCGELSSPGRGVDVELERPPIDSALTAAGETASAGAVEVSVSAEDVGAGAVGADPYPAIVERDPEGGTVAAGTADGR